jgi:hypothetical protein
MYHTERGETTITHGSYAHVLAILPWVRKLASPLEFTPFFCLQTARRRLENHALHLTVWPPHSPMSRKSSVLPRNSLPPMLEAIMLKGKVN